MLHAKSSCLSAIVLLSVSCMTARAFLYGEHKWIGDEAFSRVYQSETLLQTWGRNLDLTKQLSFIPDMNSFFMKNPAITYGDLNALAADHAEHPLELYAEIHAPFSRLLALASLQHDYLGRFLIGASSTAVLGQDVSYLSMVIEDQSHFYRWSKGFSDHLAGCRKEMFHRLTNLNDTEAYGKLKSANAIVKYVYLHAVALHYVDRARRAEGADRNTALRLALVINGFADHFLEDAFSAGHRMSNRSILGGITTDKFMHDFFGECGSRALNLRGQEWTTFGDGRLSTYGHNEYDTSLISENHGMVVNAVARSIQDLLDHYRRLEDKDTANVSQYNEKHALLFNDTNERIKGLIAASLYRALTFIPLPYETDRTEIQEAKRELHSKFTSGFMAVSRASFADEIKTDGAVDPAYIRYADIYASRNYVDRHKGIKVFIHRGYMSEHGVDAPRDYWYNGFRVANVGIMNNFLFDNVNMIPRRDIDVWLDLGFQYDCRTTRETGFSRRIAMDLEVKSVLLPSAAPFLRFLELGIGVRTGLYKPLSAYTFYGEPYFLANIRAWPFDRLGDLLDANFLFTLNWKPCRFHRVEDDRLDNFELRFQADITNPMKGFVEHVYHLLNGSPQPY